MNPSPSTEPVLPPAPDLKSEIGNLECPSAAPDSSASSALSDSALPAPMFPDRIIGHDVSKALPVAPASNLKSGIGGGQEEACESLSDLNQAPSPNPQFLQALSALQQLPGESRHCHDLFFLFARTHPRPHVKEFAREHGLHRNTVDRWRKRYRWEERINHYSAACSRQTLQTEFTRVQAQTSREEQKAELELDLRARALDLARNALQAWQSNADQTPTVQGVVRAFELAMKLNPPASPVPDKNALENDLCYLDFMERINKVYGPEAEAAHAARVASAAKRTEVTNGDQR
jgi:transposase-like protein